MAKFLIAGGAGFIGSNLVDFLLKEGHEVRVVDNFLSGKEENLVEAHKSEHFELIRGDIRDKEVMTKACEGVDYVHLLAALRSVPQSMKNPLDYNDVNINGILTVLEACRDQGVKRLVFSSSSSVYGDVDTFPEVETQYPQLISPYALSKLAGEYYCRIFSEHFGVETVCLRYFNVYGPRQALDDEYAVVIPKFIHCILNDEQPPVFGNGKQSRDFTFVDNVVSANYLSAITPGLKHEIFNVANGSDNSILELIALLNKIIGKNIEPNLLPVRAGDVFKTHADLTNIQTKIGFKVLVDFEEGLRRTVEYFKQLSNG